MKILSVLALAALLLAGCGNDIAVDLSDPAAQPVAESSGAVATTPQENPDAVEVDADEIDAVEVDSDDGPSGPEPAADGSAVSTSAVDAAPEGGDAPEPAAALEVAEAQEAQPEDPAAVPQEPLAQEPVTEAPAEPVAVVPEPTAPPETAAQQPAERIEVELPPGFVPGEPATHPLAISRLRGLSYPGSDLVVVQDLPAGGNYSRAVATYTSEGLTIRGLLTVPNGERPPSGWPVIVFNHGYIPPAQYRTTERYVAYQDAFARAGYITYKSDYRGHGSSEGESGSSRGTPDYTIDVMNALASVARHPDADPNRIGMWGHSMGGLITLKSMVISDRIKAGVIWAGVVASYPDLYNRLGREDRPSSGSWDRPGRRSWRIELLELFGPPEENASAWAAVSPNAHLDRISGPLQLHHGTADSSVPVIYSSRLQEQMDAAGRPSETFIYEGDDHNLAGSLSTALARSVEFFDRHVKGEG